MTVGVPGLTLTRIFDATCEEVFAAWTDAESMRQWMCPEGVTEVLVQLDVRVGGSFRIVMKHGADRLVHVGVYREIEHPRRLVFTWVSPATGQRETLVTVELRPLGDRTELTLTHTQLPDADAVVEHTRGWSGILEHLTSHLK